MKIIVSHDVDHITAWEHKKDLLIPKFLIRGLIEYGMKAISLSELMSRFASLIHNRWQNLEELIAFNKSNNIPATFFIGVNNGKGLSYSQKKAAYWIRKISAEGFNVGVHGIVFDNLNGMRTEHDSFKNISGLANVGIRMHYLRTNQNTLRYLNRSGYRYDSSLYEMSRPFKVEKLWEFPLHIMDSYVVIKNGRWQNRSLQESKETTKKIIESALKKNVNYLTILLHDIYFNDRFRTWKEWYIWLINYLKDNNLTFISFDNAIKELEA